MTPFLRFVATSLLAAGTTLLFSACSAFKEPAATADATPPPGYNPIFVNKIAPLPPTKPTGLKLQATRVDTRDPRKVRVYMHMVDSTGTYYYGGNAGNFKNMWCKVIEELGTDKRDVKKFTVKEVTELDKEPTAIAIVMDNSGSMGVARAIAVQEAVDKFIDTKLADDAVALLRYDHHVEVEAGATTNPASLKSQLQKNGLDGFGGGTAIHSAIEGGVNHLVGSSASFGRKAVIVFTDGQENSSTISKEVAIDMAQKNNVLLCGVDFGEGINKGYMESIVSPTGGSYSHIYGTAEFEPMFQDVYRRLKNYYVVEYPIEDYGKHNVSIRFCYGKDTVTSSFAYDNTPDIGTTALLNVFFDSDKSDLKPESKRAIENVAAMMRAFPTMTIEVRGHTDNSNKTKDPQHNVKLSQRRADSVRDALVKAGVTTARIASVGLGEKEPISPNDTDEGKSQNRRTEFKIISK